MKIKKKSFFFSYCPLRIGKFGHRKHDISKTFTARSFKLAQLMEDKGENLKKKKNIFFLVIALCKFCHRKIDVSKTVSNLR